MGGSSNNAAQTQLSPAASPTLAAQPAVPMQQYAAFSPGQQGLLAQQMQSGFGGSLLDHMNAMSFYKDMRVPVINSPADLASFAPAAAPAAPALSPSYGRDRADAGGAPGAMGGGY